MMGMKEYPSVKRKEFGKKVICYCGFVTKYLLSFIGSVESFTLVPS